MTCFKDLTTIFTQKIKLLTTNISNTFNDFLLSNFWIFPDVNKRTRKIIIFVAQKGTKLSTDF